MTLCTTTWLEAEHNVDTECACAHTNSHKCQMCLLMLMWTEVNCNNELGQIFTFILILQS